MLLSPVSGWTYEVDTHALITANAYEQSQVATDSEIAARLGWARYPKESPFNLPNGLGHLRFERAYLDVSAPYWEGRGQGEAFMRFPFDDYELVRFPGDTRTVANRASEVRAWFIRGAIREDDLPQKYYQLGEPRPDADRFGEVVRVFHHFYDPANDRGLTPTGIGILGWICESLPDQIPSGHCVNATDWAMGTPDETVANDAQSPPDRERRNHFTWADAREAMWCGLISRTVPSNPEEDAVRRRYCWATMALSLGHVLHLLQDLSQPQHTRNDRHNPPLGQVWDFVKATDMSRRTYESYTNWLATKGRDVGATGLEGESYREYFTANSTLEVPPTSGYPIPRFTTPIDYFTTRRLDADIRQRRGLADFSNRNFVSEGTQFSSYDLPGGSDLRVEQSPPLQIGSRVFREERKVWDVIDTVAPGYRDPVLAAYNGHLPLSLTSLWRDFDARIGESKVVIPLAYYRAHAYVLLPRAVAYSTGLIDFFFRGKLEVSDPTQGLVAAIDQGVPHRMVDGYPRRLDNNQIMGFTRLRLTVRNTTAAITETGTGRVLPQGMANGLIIAVARYHRNPCYLPSLQGEWVKPDGNAPASIPSGACTLDQTRTNYEEASISKAFLVNSEIPSDRPRSYAFDFSLDPIPINATDLFVQVVYRGQLGAERDGIAVGRMDLPEPYYFPFLNGTDFVSWHGTWRETVPGDRDNTSPELVKTLLLGWNEDVNSPLTGVIATTRVPLPPKRFVRFALIGRSGTGKLRTDLTTEFHGSLTLNLPSPMRLGTIRQAETEEIGPDDYSPVPLVIDRGVIGNINWWYSRRDGDRPDRPRSELPTVDPNAMPEVITISSPY